MRFSLCPFIGNIAAKGVVEWQLFALRHSELLFQMVKKRISSKRWKPFAGSMLKVKPTFFFSMWRDRQRKGGESMNGYERLSFKEAQLVWDQERYEIPEQEKELLLGEINRLIESQTGDPEPCDLYDRCWECPNFEDCYGIPTIPNEVRGAL
jgi:hypothetical protein